MHSVQFEDWHSSASTQVRELERQGHVDSSLESAKQQRTVGLDRAKRGLTGGAILSSVTP